MRVILTCLCLWALTPGMAWAAESPQGFARRPAARKENGRSIIEFAAGRATDAAVYILNAKGQVVRHLAAGVLGKNAPPPLQKDTLVQKLIWDGRDDAGKPAAGGPFKARVGLGLGMQPDKVIADPAKLGGVLQLALRPGGELYALNAVRNMHKGDASPNCQVLDRSGKYLRTIMPWPGELPP